MYAVSLTFFLGNMESLIDTSHRFHSAESQYIYPIYRIDELDGLIASTEAKLSSIQTELTHQQLHKVVTKIN